MSASSTVLARLLDTARADDVAVRDREGDHRYAAIVTRARNVAGALLEGRETLSGERVAIAVDPGARFVEVLVGILLAGGCAVVLSPLHAAAEWTYACDDAEVKIVVASESLLERAKVVAASRRILPVAALEPRAPVLVPVAGDAPALQLYTSGTTGKPKGAVLSHDNLAIQQELLGEAWGLRADDVLLHALPLHHMHGLCIALLSCLGAGASARMLPKFEAIAVWEAMAESTVLMAVPTMYAKLLGAFDAADEATRARWRDAARGLRLATSGSAALPVTLAERWRTIAGTIPVERFGMTEIGVGATNPLHGERRPGTVGPPLRTVATRVVGDDGTPAETGELWVAGPSVFSGYWRRPDATAKAFTEIDGTRWFRTGDTVRVEPDGYVRILGRTSVDILKTGGYKVSALEIEDVLREHPGVDDVAVVGVADETWGERVVACVVPVAGAAFDEASLRAFAKERLAAYKVPKRVLVTPSFPRTAVGKVVKPELAKWAADQLRDR